MPFKSERQRRWMHATHPEMAKRWEAETPDKKLPERAGKKSEKKPSLPSNSELHAFKGRY